MKDLKKSHKQLVTRKVNFKVSDKKHKSLMFPSIPFILIHSILYAGARNLTKNFIVVPVSPLLGKLIGTDKKHAMVLEIY